MRGARPWWAVGGVEVARESSLAVFVADTDTNTIKYLTNYVPLAIFESDGLPVCYKLFLRLHQGVGEAARTRRRAGNTSWTTKQELAAPKGAKPWQSAGTLPEGRLLNNSNVP